MSIELNRRSWLRSLWVLILCAGLLLPRSAGAVNGTQNQLLLPLMGNKACSGRMDPNIPIGVQMYGNTGRTSPLFPSLLSSGAAWLRVTADWNVVEPSNVAPANFRWSSVDNSVAASVDACVNVIVTVDHTADWAATQETVPGYPNRSPIKTDNLADFAQFVGALVERYDGDGIDDAPNGAVVEYWEMYNEPDYGNGFDGGGWGENGARYAQMLSLVYPALKAANPNAKLVLGGLSYDWFVDDGGIFVRSFLENVLSAGGGDFFDVMNFHYYPSNREAWTSNPDSTGFAEKIQAVRATLAANGLDKPIFVTEVGWHSNASVIFPSTDEIQNRYVVQLLTQALANNVQVAIWWTLQSPGGTHPFDTGLVTASNPPVAKPAYGVFQQTMNRLGHAQFDTMVTAAETGAAELEVYRFMDLREKQTTYVAWRNPSESNATSTLTLAVAGGVVYSKSGALLGTVKDGDDGVQDGKITHQVGGSPVYIVVK